MEPARLSRIVAHSLWLTVAAAAQLLFLVMVEWTFHDSDPDFGRGPGGGLLLLVMLSPVWVTACVVAGGLTGLGAGLAAESVARAGGGARAQAAAGALASGTVAAVLALALVTRGGALSGSSPGYVAVLGTVGLVTGGSAVLVSQTAAARLGRSRALGWGVATLVLGSATLLGGGWLELMTDSYDVAGECAGRLHVDEVQVVWAQIPFPPQLWCLSGDVAQPTVPAWTDALLVLGITSTLVCIAAALRSLPGSRTTARWLLAVIVVVGLSGTGGAAWSFAQQAPADAVERARVAASRTPEASPTALPQAIPSPTPSAEPTTTLPAARAALAELGRVARAGRTDLVWPDEPAVQSAPCTLADGGSGSVLSLTGRFTTRDMADVKGPAEVLEVSRANERVAAELVDDWLASGLLRGSDVLHGEWYLGAPDGGPVESAHVGFTDAVGEFRVVSHCASR